MIRTARNPTAFADRFSVNSTLVGEKSVFFNSIGKK